MNSEHNEIEICRISSSADLEACFRVRHIVFVGEQNVPVSLEKDEFEAESVHFLGRLNGLPVAAARFRRLGGSSRSTIKIQRVAVLKSCRGRGFGRRIMEEMLNQISEIPDIEQVVLDAQSQALPFYCSLGFGPQGEEFLDAGIPHLKMVMRLPDNQDRS